MYMFFLGGKSLKSSEKSEKPEDINVIENELISDDESSCSSMPELIYINSRAANDIYIDMEPSKDLSLEKPEENKVKEVKSEPVEVKSEPVEVKSEHVEVKSEPVEVNETSSELVKNNRCSFIWCA
jgi:hypothetical protein